MISRLTALTILFLSLNLFQNVVFSTPHAKATLDYTFEFPRDHGQHTHFQTEWWYYTGLLFPKGMDVIVLKDGKRQFNHPERGFQLTFFRRLQSENNQLWLAHASLSTFTNLIFLHESRFSTGALLAAGASANFLEVWNNGWSVESVANRHMLRFELAESRIRLLATPNYGPILQGENGYSLKGPCSDCASLYYSLPSLSIEGEIVDNGQRELVHGLAWMDHEFMTNALQDYQTGWDWFSLYHVTGKRIMAFQVRSDDEKKIFRSGSVIDVDGSRKSVLDNETLTIEPLEYWTSADSDARYPVKWRLNIEGETVELSAIMNDQELITNTAPDKELAYWEGGVRSSDGSYIGFLEMTGYTGVVPEI